MVDATNDVVQLLSSGTFIAAVRFHFSPTTSGATFDGTTNWVDFGALDPASPAFEFNKEILDVMTGAPQTVQQRHITQYNGMMSAEVMDYTSTAFQATIGTTVDKTINSPMGWVDTDIAAGASTRSHLFVTDASDLAIGDHIAVELGDTAFTWYEIRKITQITIGVAPAAEVDLYGQLSEIPAVGAEVLKVERVDSLIGGNDLREYQMRSIASFNDGSTMVIHAPKGNFTGTMSPNYGDGTSVARIPVEFGIIGTSGTVAGFGCPQVTLATHYAYYGAC